MKRWNLRPWLGNQRKHDFLKNNSGYKKCQKNHLHWLLRESWKVLWYFSSEIILKLFSTLFHFEANQSVERLIQLLNLTFLANKCWFWYKLYFFNYNTVRKNKTLPWVLLLTQIFVNEGIDEKNNQQWKEVLKDSNLWRNNNCFS